MLRTRLVSYVLSLTALWVAMPSAAQEVVAPPPAPVAAQPIIPPPPVPCMPTPPVVPPAPPPPATPTTTPAPPASTRVPVLFESSPLGAKVMLNGERVCVTPCRLLVDPGVHHVSMQLEYHVPKSERVTLAADSAVSFALAKKPYHFFLMNDLSDFGTVLTTAFDPSDARYRFITVLDGAHFAGLSSAFDSGISGGVFSYRHSPRGSSWSIFGFGPSLRIGRLIATSHVELLSFRHDAPESVPKGWRPGLTSRLQLPLLTVREGRSWATLLPVPTVGVDVWADRELNHDETAFWVGLAWLPGTDY